MFKFLLRKLPSVLAVALASSIIAFFLPRLAPGDPAIAIAGPEATLEQLTAVREQMGLNDPVIVQYFNWLTGVLQGDFGQSFTMRRPVAEVILSRIESTLELALLSMVLLVAFGIGLGILAGTERSKWARVAIDGTITFLLAMPPFVIGLIFILFLGIMFPLFPISGEVLFSENLIVGLHYLVLPALAISLAQASIVARQLQATMLSTRDEDFIDLARAKGVPDGKITRQHVLRNSLGPAVVAIGLRFGDMLAGAVIIEAIFARNGVGALAIYAVQSRDYNVLQAIILGAVLIAVFTQLISEIVLAALDPRIRLEG
ncbi:ABC transporter permease [Pelagibacterium halotolerans]|uniref:Dipeptide transport system permease protein DppB n=1 Tax=Pelagibacterium halotolerans (strain DSM 22347 / JCM 15775 / CGMCC 1.7692 / B2) TaxID=1082931 RepID=G4R7F3_PELHB|nr:ABC transporter permease [Pelagibacterium halotolerans]AEQ51278.1 dipeptide transport system permease protein DppB [Pelagibacterium halotolerans B2]QJR18866.1 ABC transporter permease [Pelagibacterium halotolerans]SEA66619.1 peptide/nickel transport system permease protein [Pelagibacterium halotolerans]